MVLLSTFAMHPARARPSRHAPPSSSSSTSSSTPYGLGFAHTSPHTSGFAHTNGYFYSPSHSEDSTPTKGASTDRVRANSGSFQDVTSMAVSPVTSPRLYTSLTNLDEWSPATVSLSSLLRHSHGQPARQQSSDVSEDDAGSSQTTVDSPSTDPFSLSYSSMPERSGGPTGKAVLRRTLSAEPHMRTEIVIPHRGEEVGGPSLGDDDVPRVPGVEPEEEEDSAESEYVTLDYRYVPGSATRASLVLSERDTGRHSDLSPASSSHSDTGSYRHYYSDETNYYHLNDCCSSSGYTSNGSSSLGSQGSPQQHGGTLPMDRASKAKSVSMDRLWTLPRTAAPADRTRASLPRKKPGQQTLQTVAENIVQGLAQPPKSILKNSSSSHSQHGSGSSTPRSNASSCRSSITSRQDCCSSVLGSDFGGGGSEPCSSARSRLGPLSPQHADQHKHLSHTFGGTPSPSAVAEAGDSDRHPHRLRLRSKSMSDLRPDSTDMTNSAAASGCYSDDEDGDDFGFLSRSNGHGGAGVGVGVSTTPGVFPSRAVMHKGKAAGGTSSPSHRLLPRRWRNKNKNSSSSSSTAHQAQAMWSPEGPCTWCSVSGRKVILKPVSMVQLSEAERLALQKLACTKLQSMDLGCPIVIPKDASDLRRQKKRALSLKRRSKSANLASLLDTLSSDKTKDKENKDVKPGGLVFGIPLSRCIANDREATKRRRAKATAPSTSAPSTLLHSSRTDSSDQLLSPRRTRKSSSSSQGSMDNGAQNGSMAAGYDSARRAASSDSLSESDHSSRNTSSSLIEALTLQAAPGDRPAASQAVGSTPQVPQIVDACFKHLETHGLHVLGIFRVGSSKKRVKQLREEFDSGKEVELGAEHKAHDVGALLKEFFRDLPEPLLTRDLYLPFVTTRKIKDRETQAEAVRLLLTLLPPANRDTLWSLLRFLATVHRHSEDTVDSSGREIAGNKMDSHNLATLFGPNILHRARAVNEKQFMAECAEQAEQSSEVIGVIKDMIDNHFELFQISAEQRDDVLKLMMEADHENLDRVLRRLSNENQIEPDPESMCSVFEADSEVTQSLPHSANSDADLLQLLTRRKATVPHQPLRPSRSADPWTDPPQRANTYHAHPLSPAQRVSSLDSAAERLSHSPSPQDSPSGPFSPPKLDPGSGSGSGYGSLPRPPVVTISQESPEVVLRESSRRRGQEAAAPRPLSAHLTGRERPYSEAYTGSLNIPKPAFLRENSGASSASCSSYLSSSGGHASDSSGHWVLPTPPASQNASPQPPRRSNNSGSRADSRRRGMLTSSSRSDDDDGASPAVGSPEWQRERWRHWQEITAGRNSGAGDAEQETLV
ncbi:uncharacterized protein LOC143298629 [Babylonia areolata]|uniref:uncharacterized protein LOC143298629 n=1 Tax=Babylonia areolata TaxID=304850 RepID=UPI003FD00054